MIHKRRELRAEGLKKMSRYQEDSSLTKYLSQLESRNSGLEEGHECLDNQFCISTLLVGLSD